MTSAAYDSTASYPRDLAGYGRNPPHAQWPNQARIAVQFVLNYEEGDENAFSMATRHPSNFCQKCSTRQPSRPGI
jgi:hypothetical protein